MSADLLSMPTDEFLDNIESVAKRFDIRTYPQQVLPRDDWALLAQAGVMLPALPREYGGRDSHIEMCRIIERITEYNLPVGMYTMIITAAVLRPIAMRGSEELKREMLPLFAKEPLVCGFALTEPCCGSGMVRMSTTYEEVDGGYRIRGTKHWQGFSPTADWWLVTAKKHGAADSRRFAYFAIKRSEGFRTVERYEPLGLKAIGYGLNQIDAFVPAYRRIDAEETDLSAVVEMLMPPRVMMGALACGFLKRIDREAREYTEDRDIGPATLFDIPFVKYKLKMIEAARTLCEALYHYIETRIDLKADMLDSFPAVQAIKTLSTERMMSSAYHYQQLCGNEGYRYGASSNVASQALLDAEIYPVLDGTNDLLSQQLAEDSLKKCAGSVLSDFLATYPLTSRGIAEQQLDLRFLDRPMTQEYLVLAGRAIAIAFGVSRLLDWMDQADDDTRQRARIAIEFLKCELAGIPQQFILLDKGILHGSGSLERDLVTA